MLPGLEMMACTDLAVPVQVMQHVVRVESSFNPYAIGVVGGRLARQPRNLPEALSTARMLEREGYNFSLGLAQVNRYNLTRYGLGSYERAFDICPNLQAGSRILAECYSRSGNDWGKALSCYYSGNFVTGFRHGYVQKVLASWQGSGSTASAIPVIGRGSPASAAAAQAPGQPSSIVMRRVQEAAATTAVPPPAPPPMVQATVAAAPALPASTHVSFQASPSAPVQPAAPAAAIDAPVLVQSMSASLSPSVPARGADARGVAQPRAAATSRRDDAFVF